MRRHFYNGGNQAKLDKLLADFRRRVDHGERIDQQAVVAAHPELAADLRDYFSQAAAATVLGGGADDCCAVPIRTDVDTCSYNVADTGKGHFEVRCPGCNAPMQVAVDTALTDLTC